MSHFVPDMAIVGELVRPRLGEKLSAPVSKVLTRP